VKDKGCTVGKGQDQPAAKGEDRLAVRNKGLSRTSKDFIGKRRNSHQANGPGSAAVQRNCTISGSNRFVGDRLYRFSGVLNGDMPPSIWAEVLLLRSISPNSKFRSIL